MPHSFGIITALVASSLLFASPILATAVVQARAVQVYGYMSPTPVAVAEATAVRESSCPDAIITAKSDCPSGCTAVSIYRSSEACQYADVTNTGWNCRHDWCGDGLVVLRFEACCNLVDVCSGDLDLLCRFGEWFRILCRFRRVLIQIFLDRPYIYCMGR